MELLSGGKRGTSKWIVEDQSEEYRLVVNRDTMDVIAQRGMTIWYNQKLKGDYKISYRAMFPTGGEYDRVSDLNCFWGASDPASPNDMFGEKSAPRDGDFSKYSPLDLFYVGYGGNKNRTTRFRRYYGEYVESDPAKNRPVIKEYLEPENRLYPEEWIQIEITVKDGRTTYSANGKVLFDHPLEEGQDEGYFGIRLVRNHALFTDFSVEKF